VRCAWWRVAQLELPTRRPAKCWLSSGQRLTGRRTERRLPNRSIASQPFDARRKADQVEQESPALGLRVETFDRSGRVQPLHAERRFLLDRGDALDRSEGPVPILGIGHIKARVISIGVGIGIDQTGFETTGPIWNPNPPPMTTTVREQMQRLSRDTGAVDAMGEPLFFEVGDETAGLDTRVVDAVRRPSRRGAVPQRNFCKSGGAITDRARLHARGKPIDASYLQRHSGPGPRVCTLAQRAAQPFSGSSAGNSARPSFVSA
jgi:hypothetical protein